MEASGTGLFSGKLETHRFVIARTKEGKKGTLYEESRKSRFYLRKEKGTL